ncbi:DUF1796 family putative cysteine peptidase [Pseudomonas sp. FW300-N1A1]|uniref:DUF1796 family putative cysteine peptidase n=1 Tax=Pseudomonas sp. FW300-N1A1 TaxID=2075555 RepID=UPI001304FFF5|nr:DUF1796 family putative cysteine peptidase [Pseudomonas sp. FW300-N1A1]
MLFVSLGAWCQVSYQLKKHCGEQFISSAFDWLVTPLHSVSKIFDTNGDSFAQDIFIGDPSKSVECKKYGVLYHHEYRKGQDKISIIEDDKTSNAREKLEYKHKKMVDTLKKTEEEVIFIRFGGHALPAAAWPYMKDREHISSEQLNQLPISIQKALPNLRFRIILIRDAQYMNSDIETQELDNRFSFLHVERGEKPRWEGSDAHWMELINKIQSPVEALA